MDITKHCVPIEAHRLFEIWAAAERAGTLEHGCPSRSAGFSGGAIHSIDDLEESIDAGIARTCATILDEMHRQYPPEYWSVYNLYVGGVARYRGDPAATLAAACARFMAEWLRRGGVL